MWLLRVILILVVFWVIALILGWFVKRALLKKIQTFQKRESRPTEVAALVKCAQCGTYIEEEKALKIQNKTYCSAKHAPPN